MNKRMKTNLKRVLSVLICMMMIVSCLPLTFSASAADNENWTYVEGTSYEPVNVYVYRESQTTLEEGKTYRLAVYYYNYMIGLSDAGEPVLSINSANVKERTEQEYYTSNDGSDVYLDSTYYYKEDEPGADFQWVGGALKSVDTGKYLTNSGTSALAMSSTATTWTNSSNYLYRTVSSSSRYIALSGTSNSSLKLSTSTTYAWICYFEKVTVYDKVAGGNGGYYAIGGVENYDVAIGSDFTVDDIKAGTNILYKSSENGTVQNLSWDSEEITYSAENINTSVPGTYTMHVYASGNAIGDVTVTVAEDPNVQPVSVPNKITVEQECNLNGSVRLDGITFELLMSDGTYRTVQVTESMLSEYTTDTAGTKVITIDYSDTINAGMIKLTVGEADEDVTLKKESKFLGNSFMETGIANIELSITGKHTEKGMLDVLIISDVSNSMAWGANASNAQYNYNPAKLTDKLSKMESMKDAISNFTSIILGDLSNGTNTMSMVTFGGYDAERVSKTGSYVDATRTLFTSLNTKTAVDNYLDRISLTMSGTKDGDSGNTYTLTLPNGASGTVSGTNKGGTNYDWGFWQAKQAIEQIYTDYANANNGQSYADSGRNLMVLFMSDGAPTFYNQSTNNSETTNYYYGKSGTTDYNTYYNYYKYKGINLSSYQNTFYNTCYYNTSGTKVSFSNANGFASYFTTTPNLAAQVVRNMPGVYDLVGVGYHLETGGSGSYEYTEAQLTTLMSHLYDSTDGNALYTAANSSELEAQFQELGKQFMTTVEAVVFDAVGDSFELIKTMKTSSGMDLKVDYNFEPSITVTKDGDVVEKVTFSSDGTQAYSTLKSGNIMDANGDINAQTFSYDDSEKKLTWTIGDLGTETYKISYFAYLTGSQEGTLPRGEYKTNEYAYAIVNSEDPTEIKHFVDDFDVPTLSWYDLFVSVTTEVEGYDNLSESQKELIDNSEFVYYAYFKDEDGTELFPMTGYEYDLFDGEGSFIGTQTVGADGKITLIGDQKAVFNQNHVGEIYITQEPSTVYKTNGWTSASSIDSSTDSSTGSKSPVESTETGFDAENDPSTIFNIDFVCIVSLRPRLVPDVVVLDYGKTIFTDPMLNDTEATGYKLDGLLATGPVNGTKTVDTVKLNNGNVNIEGGSEALPDGTVLISSEIPTGANDLFIYYAEATVTAKTAAGTGEKPKARYAVSNQCRIMKYAKDSTTGTTLVNTLADGEYYIDSDTDILFYRSGSVIYLYNEYRSNSTTTTTEQEVTTTVTETIDVPERVDKTQYSDLLTLFEYNGITYRAWYGSSYTYIFDQNNNQITSLKSNGASYTISGTEYSITRGSSRMQVICVYPKTTTETITTTVKTPIIKSASQGVYYTPFKYMSSIDKVYYYASLRGTGNNSDSGDVEVLYSTITYIPATTVYYEDDFGGSAEDGGLYIQYTGNWYTVTDDGTQTSGITANTDTDDRQDRGEVGEDHVPYGYDSSYTDCTKFSNGSAAVVTGTVSKDASNKPQYDASAQFTFTGTGFDLISRTDLDCGMITISVYDSDGEFIENVPVINKGIENLYQIPVISYTGLDYGTYTIKINVNAPTKLLNITGSKFYLDAIRIYDPMGLSSSDNAEFDEANDAYLTDKEANAYVASIRDYILTIEDLGVDESMGAVYVDTLDNEYTAGGVIDKSAINDFLISGPNEEVYLTPGKGVGFALVCSALPESVQLEIKIPAPLDNSANIYVQTLGSDGNFVGTAITREVNSAAEMFYDITDAVQFQQIEKDGDAYYRAVVVLSNGLQNADSGDIISITNVKMTYPNKVTNIVETKDVEELTTESLTTMTLTEDGIVEEEPTEVKVGMMASWGIYCDVFETVYTQYQATIPTYDVTLVKDFDSALKGQKASATFSTSQFVSNLVVTDENGNYVNAKVETAVDEELLYSASYQNAKTWNVTINAADEGTHTYTVSAIDGEGATAQATLEVAPRTVTSLKVVSAPTKTKYNYGESIDTSGLVLEATYSDGTTEKITSGYTLSMYTAKNTGTKTVKVNYMGAEASFKITVTMTFKQVISKIFGFGWLFKK